MPSQSTIFLVVAPYCPVGREGYTALGAASKIEAVLVGLSANGMRPQLLNTGHQGIVSSAGRRLRLQLHDLEITEIHPINLGFRPLGKFLQALIAPIYVFRLCYRKDVSGLWLYNSYIFEVIFGVCARLLKPGLPIVLELEDAPTARRRSGFGRFKVALDTYALRWICRRANVITLVQPGLRAQVQAPQAQFVDLPVLLQSVPGIRKTHTYESMGTAIGYFGGLDREKGVDELLKVIAKTGPNITWHVTGVGDQADALRALASARPGLVHFHGAVSAARFREIYASVDAVINLHRPLSEFGEGIFPFKFLEAIGAGKLLISTPAIGCPPEIYDAVVWVQGDIVGKAVEAVNELQTLLNRSQDRRSAASHWVQTRYGAQAAVANILKLL